MMVYVTGYHDDARKDIMNEYDWDYYGQGYDDLYYDDAYYDDDYYNYDQAMYLRRYQNGYQYGRKEIEPRYSHALLRKKNRIKN